MTLITNWRRWATISPAIWIAYWVIALVLQRVRVVWIAYIYLPSSQLDRPPAPVHYQFSSVMSFVGHCSWFRCTHSDPFVYTTVDFVRKFHSTRCMHIKWCILLKILKYLDRVLLSSVHNHLHVFHVQSTHHTRWPGEIFAKVNSTC